LLLVLPVVQRLRNGGDGSDVLGLVAEKIVTTERELTPFNYVRRRLAFLVSDETLFNAIEAVEYKHTSASWRSTST